jgi:hypothetical protein
MDLTNLPSKLSRAIRFYLIQNGVGDPAHVFHMFDNRLRDLSVLPITIVTVGKGDPDAPFTGDNQYTVFVTTKFIELAQQTDTNSESYRVTFDAAVGAARMPLMQSDDNQTLKATYKAINAAAAMMPVTPPNPTADQIQFAANNADMADFTIMQWLEGYYGPGKAEDCSFEIVQVFQAIACEQTIEGYT